MESERSKTTKIGVRLTQREFDLIKLAAHLMECSLSKFVVSSAFEAAERTIDNNASIQLSNEDQVQFAHALLFRHDQSPGMRRASEDHPRLIEPAFPTPEPEST